MENKFKQFENAGLKIEKERVLTYSKLSCPLDCTYCFVNEMTQEQSRNASYLNNEQLDLLKNLPEEVKLIMLGCDTEFFQDKEDALNILNKLTTFGKDISVITKLPLSESFLEEIRSIVDNIESTNNIFSFSVSVPCLSESTVAKYEPNVPHPMKRIETLQSAYKKGLHTMLAIRPLLPDATNEELEEIVKLTKDYCTGYYSGPLYLKEEKINLFFPDYRGTAKEIQPKWMLEGNTYVPIMRDGQMDFLLQILKKYDKKMFEGAADGMEYIRKNLKS